MIEQVKAIVKEASKMMVQDGFRVNTKGDDSNLVTEKDEQIQRFLSARLQALLPGSTVVGEENGETDFSGREVWVIDPIDGTSNFVRDLGLSVISVGLVKDGEPIMGVVYHPYRDEIFYAEKGKGAFVNGRPIHVSDHDFAHSHLCSAMSLYDKRYAPPCFKIIEKVYYESDDLRRLGTAALELSSLAAGRVELYFEVRISAWDAAGAIAIIKEAGGFVEILFHDTLPMDKPFGLIAANSAENFARLKEIVYGEIPQPLY